MTFADDAAMRTALRAPFAPELVGLLPATSKRPALPYVGHAAVVDRLNEAAPDWTYSVEPVVVNGNIVIEDRKARFVPDPEGLSHVVAVFGTITVGGISRQEVGDVDNFTTYGDELKKAISDFIRRGAMRFGVALDLWSKEDLSNVGESTPAANVTSAPGTPEAGHTSGSPAPSLGSEESFEGTDPEAGLSPLSSTSGSDTSGELDAGQQDGAGAESYGEGGTTPPPSYLNAAERKVFAKALGGESAARKLAQERFGERIRSLQDVTRGMALELVTAKAGAA